MSPSIDLKWCHVEAVTLLAFYKSIKLLFVLVVPGQYVANKIMVCFPTLFLASFLIFYVSVPVDSYPIPGQYVSYPWSIRTLVQFSIK